MSGSRQSQSPRLSVPGALGTLDVNTLDGNLTAHQARQRLKRTASSARPARNVRRRRSGSSSSSENSPEPDASADNAGVDPSTAKFDKGRKVGWGTITTHSYEIDPGAKMRKLPVRVAAVSPEL